MIQLFLDTNVIFSALLSREGAAFELMNRSREKSYEIWTSNLCLDELNTLEKKIPALKSVSKFLRSFPISTRTIHQEKKIFEQYVFDRHDSHVAQGAFETGAQFLITYNGKDFNRDLMFKNLNITVCTQGHFLQWLRGRRK